MLFSRVVPSLKDIGICGPKIQKTFEDMGEKGSGKTSFSISSVSFDGTSVSADWSCE